MQSLFFLLRSRNKFWHKNLFNNGDENENLCSYISCTKKAHRLQLFFMTYSNTSHCRGARESGRIDVWFSLQSVFKMKPTFNMKNRNCKGNLFGKLDSHWLKYWAPVLGSSCYSQSCRDSRPNAFILHSTKAGS